MEDCLSPSLCLISGCRSELHALTKSFMRTENWEELTLFVDSSFVTKTELACSSSSSKPLIIPSLRQLSSDLNSDRTLCPVRALRIYLGRTKELHEGNNRLFISYKSCFKGDIEKATVSSWIKNSVICL